MGRLALQALRPSAKVYCIASLAYAVLARMHAEGEFGEQIELVRRAWTPQLPESAGGLLQYHL
jgi:hypothetical protein